MEKGEEMIQFWMKYPPKESYFLSELVNVGIVVFFSESRICNSNLSYTLA